MISVSAAGLEGASFLMIETDGESVRYKRF